MGALAEGLQCQYSLSQEYVIQLIQLGAQFLLAASELFS